MLKQKFQNGFWIGITAFVCPACLSVFHFVPFLFILSIFLTSILACLGFYIPALILWGVYLAADITMSILAVISASPEHKKDITNIFLPFLFPLLHIAYGIGTLIGIINVPFKISHIKISKV